MKLNLSKSFKTAIHFLYTMCLLVSLVYATAASAETSPAPAPVLPPGMYPYSNISYERQNLDSARAYCGGPDKLKDGKVDQACVDQELQRMNYGKDREYCSTIPDKIEEGMKAAGKACGNLQFDEKKSSREELQCARKLKACTENGGGTASMSMVGQMLMTPASQIQKNCSISPKDYYSRKDKINKDIDSLDDKIKTGNEKINTILKAVQKETGELNKELVDEEKEFKKRKAARKSQALEEEEKAVQSDMDAAAALYQLQGQRIDIRQNIQTAYTLHKRESLKLSNDITRLECLGKVEKMKASMPKASKTSMSNLTAQAKQNREILETVFAKCNETFDEERFTIGQNLKNKIESLETQLAEVERRIVEKENAVAQAGQRRQQRLANLQAEDNDDLQATMKSTQSKIAKLDDIQKSSAQEKMVAEQDLQLKIRKRTELEGEKLALGPDEKKSPSDDKSLDDFAESARAGSLRAKAFANRCCKEPNPPGGENCAAIEGYSKMKIPTGSQK